MDEILNSMRERMPWSVARFILKSAQIEPGHGWQKTIEKLAGQDLGGFEGALLDKIAEHNLCGEKFTKIYEVSGEEHQLIQDRFATMPEPDNLVSGRYPLMVSEDQVSSLSSSPELVTVVRNTDGIGAVYSHATRLTRRETIAIGDFVEDASAITDQYDEIVGLKYRTVQLFSVVWIPHDRHAVEIRTDSPDGMTTDLMHAVQSSIRRTFNDLDICQLNRPVDLFPLLEAIYEDPAEGDVVELGFSTTTASVKNEKMRRARLDLRQEPYHLAGKRGLGTPIEPFRLFVRWSLDFDGTIQAPELGLVGTARGRSTVGQPGKVGISGAIIRNCTGRADYEHVISRMRHHLDRTAPAEPEEAR